MASDKQEKSISSVKAFVDEIMRLKNDVPPASAEQWFFRGQQNAAWDVRPNIFREDNLASEHIVIERAQRQNPVEFKECTNNFEILTKLQHYSLGTRLLDVTLNPLVALYFATEPSSEYKKNQNGQFTYQEHDGKVHYRFVRGCALRDIQVRIALSIPFVEFGKSLSLEEFCKKLVDDNVITAFEFEQLSDNDYSEMIRLLQTNSFIVATNSSIRLIQQRGAFLISSAINIKTVTEVKSSLLSKAKMNLEKEFEGCFIISAKNKKQIREELDFFNVNEATLFPELEHQMRYIQSQVISSIGTVEEYSLYNRRVIENKYEPIDISFDFIKDLFTESLPNIDEKTLEEMSNTILEETKVVDWHKKDSVLSGIRRLIVKNLADTLSSVDSKSKANEILNKLLGLSE